MIIPLILLLVVRFFEAAALALTSRESEMELRSEAV